MTDLLSAAFENLKASVLNYEYLRKFAGKEHDSTGRALHEYYRKEREFNHQVSLVIREGGTVPDLATEALTFQRMHGFHARGLAKIIAVYARKELK